MSLDSSKDDLQAVTDVEADAVFALPSLSEKLPMSFNGGKTRLDSVSFSCPCCGKPVPSQDIKVKSLDFGELSVSMEGFALCHDCQVMSPFVSRFRNDGTFSYLSNDTWKESRFADPPHAWHKFIPPLVGIGVFLVWVLFSCSSRY